jgi:hypothetical protein
MLLRAVLFPLFDRTWTKRPHKETTWARSIFSSCIPHRILTSANIISIYNPHNSLTLSHWVWRQEKPTSDQCITWSGAGFLYFASSLPIVFLYLEVHQVFNVGHAIMNKIGPIVNDIYYVVKQINRILMSNFNFNLDNNWNWGPLRGRTHTSSRWTQIKNNIPMKKITVEERTDGSMHIMHNGRWLKYEELTCGPWSKPKHQNSLAFGGK